MTSKKNITLIKGPTGSGKTKRLMDTYQTLLNNGIRADRILVLVRNRRQSILWRNAIKIRAASAIRIQSFFGFIQGEIKKYWPILKVKFKEFKEGMLEPVFLTTELSQFLMTRYVEEFRQQGKLMDITASSQKVAIEGLSNLSRAVTAQADLGRIGSQLFSACKIKNDVRERLFTEFQELLNYYSKKCREDGYIDYFFAVEIYNKYLLGDKNYKQRLEKEVKHLVVDGLEEAVRCELDFIDFMLETIETSTLSFSTDGAFLRKQGADPEYAQKIIMPKCSKVINLHEGFQENTEFYRLSEVIYDNLADKFDGTSSPDKVKVLPKDVITKLSLNIEEIQTELRSGMITEICLKIEEFIHNGFKPEDIGVICPMVDGVLEYCIESFLKQRNIKVINLSRTERYIDESFARALITLACLCHPQWDMNPPEHDISNLVGMVLGLDPVRSGLIAKKVVSFKPFTIPEIDDVEFMDRIGFKNSDRYHLLKNWIEEYRRSEPAPIDSFFQNAFITILLNLPKAEEHVNSCRLLVESAGVFLKTTGSMMGCEAGKVFVQMIRQGVKPAETIQDLEQKIYSRDIVIATPQAYLASSMRRKVQIWVDVSSQLWHRSDVQELSNPYVFSSDWKEGDIWTEETDERHKMLKSGVLVKRLLRSSLQKLVLAQSQYNQDGYENDGILAEAAEEAIDN